MHGFSKTQIKILKILIEKPYFQKDLAKKLKITGAGVKYHLDLLEKKKIIRKKLITQVGTVKIIEISINPMKLQYIRKILNYKHKGWILITGYGKYEKAYLLPNKSKKLLEKSGLRIDEVIAFTTPESKEIRDKVKNTEEGHKLIHLTEEYSFDYVQYRNIDSKLFLNLENLLGKYISRKDIILDLTPLSKLLTIKLLEISRNNEIPSFYLGKKSDDDDYLIWFKNIII